MTEANFVLVIFCYLWKYVDCIADKYREDTNGLDSSAEGERKIKGDKEMVIPYK